MLFNSAGFLLIFLPLTLVAFHAARVYGRGAGPRRVLLAASLVFYGLWDWRYLGLLAASVVFNYHVGRRLTEKPSTALLALGVGVNVASLGIFKYADFAVSAANTVTGAGFPLPGIILPLGISFFSFQKIAYLIDCRAGRTRTRRGEFADFALFATFFPQLIAGPIPRHADIKAQLTGVKAGSSVDHELVGRGIFLLTVGLFKKVVVADTIARYVDPAFAQVAQLSLFDAWTAALGYSLQLYFDFSAYSEMALGLGMLFGILLPVNFDSPYKARSIKEFWRRWHMTLGGFLRDYLYIPFGGNRKGAAHAALAMIATMLIGGLWHGAGWQFVLWGAMHGLMLAICVWWGRAGFRMNADLGKGLTFICVMLAWVMFRAGSVSDAATFYEAMAGLNGTQLPIAFNNSPMLKGIFGVSRSAFFGGLELPAFICLLAFVMSGKNTFRTSMEFRPKPIVVLALGACMLVSAFFVGSVSSFLYFRF